MGQGPIPDDWHSPASPSRSSTDRGFTAHQMLDELGLIHMNGRIYDPDTARFLSPDPYLQAPANFQNYNRYSYVLNNPVSMTDPSGHFWKWVKKTVKKIGRGFKKFWKPIVAIAVGVLTGGLALAAWGPALGSFWGAVAAGAVGGFAAGFSGTLLHGGSIGQAFSNGLIGGISGAAFGAIGAANWQQITKVVAHGLTGGAVQELQGGKFAQGFAAAGFAQAFAPAIDGLKHSYQRLTAAAVAGGVGSELAGGKFENGAVTGAFSQMLVVEVT